MHLFCSCSKATKRYGKAEKCILVGYPNAQKRVYVLYARTKKRKGFFLVWMSHFENRPFYSQKGKEIKDSSNQQEKTLLIACDVCPYTLKSQLWVMNDDILEMSPERT